ncbi:PIR Superfamily Protein [Plasmodium ovale wallikeri]|uniref:PIR Superfamily Protein n=1 Tax=Plasmodium ovale wallikeri TaxID=864142 RepID=A0A1A9AIW1_PLAOA|nr:PIR Superfamily Protein [Plasmodium ovale wallikeri]SBT56116.1 PIR Superfamily Protein [Plasmodium ovale wallikeri]
MYSFVSLYNYFISKIDGYERGASSLSDLCDNYKAIHRPDYIATGCRFLNYWLYSDDVLKDRNNFNAVAFYETLKSDDKHSYFFNIDVCGGNMEHISKDIIENIQKLIKLHEKFNKIDPKKEQLNDECEEPLECANLYEEYMEEFCVDINNVFCVELENFKPKYDAYMENKKCNDNVPKTLKYIQRVNIAAAVALPFVIILVVPFITFILYKFTSFGPWLLPRIRKNNRILDNLNDENNHMSLRDSKSHEPYMNERTYHIAYRSTINS